MAPKTAAASKTAASKVSSPPSNKATAGGTAKLSLSRSPKKGTTPGTNRPHQLYSVKCSAGVAVFVPQKAPNPGNPNARQDSPYTAYLNNARDNPEVLEEYGTCFPSTRKSQTNNPDLLDIPILTVRGYPYLQIVVVYPVVAEMTNQAVAATGRSLAHAMTQYALDDKFPATFKYVGDRTVLTEDGLYPAPAAVMFNQETLNIMDFLYPIMNEDPVQRAEALAMDFFGRETQDVINLIVNGVAFVPPAAEAAET